MRVLNHALLAVLLSASVAAAKETVSVDERLPSTATGVQTGQSSMEQSGHHRHHGKFSQALTQLPKEKAAMVREAMDQSHAQNRPLGEKLHALYDKRDGLLATPSFDKAAFIDTQKQIRTLRAQMMANTDDAVATYQEKLTPSERQSVAKAMHPGHEDGAQARPAMSASPESGEDALP